MTNAPRPSFPFELPDAVGRHWRRCCCALVAAAMLLCPASASAALIQYTSTHIAGTQWSYAYVVSNGAAAPDIEELTIYFDPLLFSNLALGGAPAGWDPVLVAPDPAIPDDGFFDVLALGPGLGAGASLAGFSVLFDFAGAGNPGAQRFEVVDPGTFAVLESGMTAALLPPGSVPEPSSLALAGLGLLALLLRRRAALN